MAESEVRQYIKIPLSSSYSYLAERVIIDATEIDDGAGLQVVAPPEYKKNWPTVRRDGWIEVLDQKPRMLSSEEHQRLIGQMGLKPVVGEHKPAGI